MNRTRRWQNYSQLKFMNVRETRLSTCLRSKAVKIEFRKNSALVMMADKLTLTSVNWDENIRVLRNFRNLLQTMMGPEGSAKAMVTGGDILEVTANSACLLARLELEHPVCRYIGHAASSLPDFGLYFGVMVCHLIEQFWSQENISKESVSKNLESLLEYIQHILTSDFVCITVDFSTINSFLPLVRTVVASKCSSFLFDVNFDSFCVAIIKSFLNCIDVRTNSVGKVYIKVETGPTSYSGHNGLLYKIVEDYDIEIIKELEGEVRVLIFTVKLDSDDDKSRISVIDQVMPILELAVRKNVRLIACQKTVATEIKLFLMRQKIVLMDRMGTDLTEALLHISQGFRISHLCFDDLFDITRLLGTVTSVKTIQFNDSNYILLQSEHVSAGTLLVQHYCLAGTAHLTALTNQAISSLRYLALHPTLTFGGGCLEIWLIAQIHMLKESKKDKDFLKMALCVQHALLSACGVISPDCMDSVYHHAWANEGLRCRCGIVSAGEVNNAGGLMISLEELVNCQSVRYVTLKPPRQIEPSTMSANVFVDAHQQKLNVIVSAFETFANISDIGLILYNN